jgi:hypothetical protein
MAPPRPFRPTSAELAELAHKYRALAALRGRKDGGDDSTARQTLRGLAQRHPGCLRELDTLGLAEIERRADAASAAAEGGPEEPWMAWITAYHRLMTAALAQKRALGRTPPGDRALALAAEASRTAGLNVDVDLVLALARPAQGRISPVVLAFLARSFGVPAARISATLFPARRPAPYDSGSSGS